jgi:hypothetical protein
MTLAILRLRQRFAGRPFQLIQSVQQPSRRHTYLPRPLAQRQGFAVERNSSCLAFIVRLFHPCRPDAVTRFVVAVGILPFDAVLRCRARTHVGRKLLEAIAPRLTHRDSSATIVPIRRVSTACAPAFSASPNAIHRGFRLAVRKLIPAFIMQAATTLRPTDAQLVASNYDEVSTGTPALPDASPTAPSSVSQHGKSAIDTTYEVHPVAACFSGAHATALYNWWGT